MKIQSTICAALLMTAASLTSCNGSLDETVFSEILENNYSYSAKDWTPNILGVYSRIRNDQWVAYWQSQELTGCDVVIAPNVSGWNDGGIYLKQHFHTWNAEQGNFNDVWNNLYAGVVLCNSAIDRVEKGLIPAPTAEQQQAGLAELRTVRAYYYWLIMDCFGDAPLVTTITQELPEKAPRADIYNFVVNELTEAIPLLSEHQDATTYARFNRWAAKCLLAEVYLNAEAYTGTAHWDECIKQCDDIINSGRCDLAPEYKDPFRSVADENSKEVLMTIPYDYVHGINGNWLYMNSWHKGLKQKFLTNATPNEAGGAKAIGQFIDTYQDGDQRLDDTWLHGLQYAADGTLLLGQYDMPGEPLNFTKDLPSANYTNEMEGYRMNKYEVKEGEEWSSETDVPLFRYSEVLLMKAECLLRQGKPGAGDLVTKVRQRNFKGENAAKAIVTDNELNGNSSYPWGYIEDYKIVRPGDQTPVKFGRMFDEWCWEFAYEARTRRTMIRFGVFTTKSWLSHEPQGDYRTVFPIPEAALTANPKLTQNPNYSK